MIDTLISAVRAGELNELFSQDTDGSDRKTIVSDCHLPDGVLLAEVKGINIGAHTVEVVCPGIGSRKLEYDFMVIAAKTGSIGKARKAA